MEMIVTLVALVAWSALTFTWVTSSLRHYAQQSYGIASIIFGLSAIAATFTLAEIGLLLRDIWSLIT